ncbi:hypothetical protein [Flammeovirga sp. SJP92]|uniref:hypothetical protein n=1 Tax=Flammeovirga sp. SJP92 TaxID=1775430 RepID=UPI0012F77E8D|nr:hypothetical protein [Flammeovirga sp. SJP92]
MISKKDFNKVEHYWIMKNTNMFFLDKEVFIIIETITDYEQPLPDIYNEQIDILNSILLKWEFLVSQIENGILSYEKITRKKLIDSFSRPHIRLFMDVETGKPVKENEWYFIVGVKENEEFGWHSEFKGLNYIQTWV